MEKIKVIFKDGLHRNENKYQRGSLKRWKSIVSEKEET